MASQLQLYRGPLLSGPGFAWSTFRAGLAPLSHILYLSNPVESSLDFLQVFLTPRCPALWSFASTSVALSLGRTSCKCLFNLFPGTFSQCRYKISFFSTMYCRCVHNMTVDFFWNLSGTELVDSHKVNCFNAESPACRHWISLVVHRGIQVVEIVATSFISPSAVAFSLFGTSLSPHYLQGKRERASALPCWRPGQCTTSKVYSASVSNQRAIWPSESRKLRSHLHWICISATTCTGLGCAPLPSLLVWSQIQC
jgi:hypothetical protein